jgi:WD40 repeat protein
VLESHPERIELLEFSPDGRRLLSASPGAKRLWDAESGALVSDLLGSARAGSATGGFTGDSKRVVSPVLGEVKIWDADCGIELAAIQSDSSWVDSCAISPDGRRIVVASPDLSIRLCDAETGSLISEPVSITHSIGQLEISPDGTRVLAIARGSSSLTLFDGSDLRVIATLIPKSSWVPHTSFSVDGKMIASGTGGMLIVWDAETGAELTRFMIDGVFSAVSFGGSRGELAALDLKGGFYLLRRQPRSY